MQFDSMSKPALIAWLAVFSFLWACLVYLAWAGIFVLFTGTWPGLIWPAVLGLAVFFTLPGAIIIVRDRG